MEPRKHLYIDALRGVAILLVVMVHSLDAGPGPAFLPPLATAVIGIGQFGVQLFFVVSAYTLMASFYSRGQELHSTRNFFIRRFFRIAPMYYTAVVYFTFQRFLGFSYFSTHAVQEPVSIGRLLSTVFFLNGFNPYWINNYVPGGWSIAVEMSFYAVLPFLCRRIRNADAAVRLLVSSAAARVLLEQLLHKTFLNSNEYLFYYFPNQLPVFSLGILAFFIVRDGFGSLSAASFALLGTLAFALNFTAVGVHFLSSVAYFFGLVALAKKPYRLVSNPLLAEVGKVSFSLYLIHFAGLYWMDRWHWNDWLPVRNAATAWVNYSFRTCLLFGFSYALAAVAYRWVERPFQRLGKRFIRRLNGGPHPSVAVPAPGLPLGDAAATLPLAPRKRFR